MEPRHYHNFTLRVSPVARRPGRYHVKVFGLILGGQPAAGERETMTYNPADPAAFVDGPLNLLDAVQFRQITARQLYALGTALAGMLLAGSIRQRWWESLKVVRERRLGLRLRLLLEAPELVALPWEFLYLRPPWEDADSELYFLGLQPDVSIVRHEALDIAEPSLSPLASYRLVAAQASPRDQAPLALDAERAAIEAAIAKLPQAGLLQPAWVENATRRALLEALRTPADILHFSGHGRLTGSGGQLILERAGGDSDPYDAAALASLVQASPLRLAILNACETGARSGANPWSGVASALVRVGVAAVVASQYPLLDTSATPLAEEIYLGVLKGLTIDEAVSNARRAIYQEAGLQSPDWGAPVLYLRAEEGFIFPPVPAPAGPQPAAPQPAGPQINVAIPKWLIQSVSPEELVDFEDQRHLFETMLDHSSEKRLMLVKAPDTCGKTSLLRMVRFHCEQKGTPWCWIDFHGQPYDNPHFTLALEMCDQLGLSPRQLAQALQPLSIYRPVEAGASAHTKATTIIEGDVIDSHVVTQILTGVSLTHDGLRQRYMKERLKRAFVTDLSGFAAEKGGVTCLFDSLEDISAEDEDWLLDALLCPVVGGELKSVKIVIAGLRLPKIEKCDWEKCTYLIDGLPPMSLEHLKIYAQKVGVELTDEAARLLWDASKRGNPFFMAMVVKNLRAVREVGS